MRKIADGLIYDTSTAEFLGEAEARCPAQEEWWWRERLYRTPRGRYFLVGEGGPRTTWARRAPDGTAVGGAGIRPLTPEQARRWAERYLPPDQYLQNFPAEEA